jgi:hypothetical protein
MTTVEGETLASFAEELASIADTPPAPAGLLKVMPPVTLLPTFMEELGRDNVSEEGAGVGVGAGAGAGAGAVALVMV